jgi:hypothetical protein
MMELALTSGIWLSIFALLAISLLILSIEKDSSTLGSAVLFLSFMIVEYGFNIPIWASIVANPILLAVYLFAYISSGIVYASFWRLPNFIKKNADSIRNDYHQWKQTDQWTSPKRDVSIDAFLSSSYYRYKIQNNKDRIISWVMLWPVGVTWEMIHKPTTAIWKTGYRIIGNTLEKVNRDTARKILEHKNK